MNRVLALILAILTGAGVLVRSEAEVGTNRVQDVVYGSISNSISNKYGELDIEDVVIIGDSNTVRMYNYSENMKSAKDVVAVVGSGVGNWRSNKNPGNTTNGKSIYDRLEEMDSDNIKNILIILGTNDFNCSELEFKSKYIELLEYLRERNSEVNLILSTIPPVNNSKSPSINNSDATRVSEWIREIANDQKLYLIDINEKVGISDMSQIYGDGYHYSKQGAIKASEIIIEEVEKLTVMEESK